MVSMPQRFPQLFRLKAFLFFLTRFVRLAQHLICFLKQAVFNQLVADDAGKGTFHPIGDFFVQLFDLCDAHRLSSFAEARGKTISAVRFFVKATRSPFVFSLRP